MHVSLMIKRYEITIEVIHVFEHIIIQPTTQLLAGLLYVWLLGIMMLVKDTDGLQIK